MALWGNTDDAANSVISAASQVNKTPNTANQADLYGNTTANAYFAGATVGQFGVDSAEMEAARESGVKPAHAGWVLRTEGQGGRAGRVHQEVLVAMRTISTDGADDATYPDFILAILTQPVDSEDATGSAVSFSVVAGSTPTGATLSYQWQLSTDSGANYSDITEAGVYSGVNTDTLAISNNTGLGGNLYRCVVSATGAADVISDGALLTETV